MSVTITKFIILLFGKFPLEWPTKDYLGEPESDPGQAVQRNEATRFDTEEEARLKGLQHYCGIDFKVVPHTYTL